jgi:tetratricopeptide (TPR) repeat protein
MNRRERRVARKFQETAISAESTAALVRAAMGHLRAGRIPDAQIACQQALALDAVHAGALHLMALLALRAGQMDDALDWVLRALQQEVRAEYLLSLGAILRVLGRLEEALRAFDRAVLLKPEVADTWLRLGDVLLALERPADALSSFQHALKLDPGHWGAACNCGNVLHAEGRLDEALVCLDRAVALRPDHAETLYRRACCLRDLRRYEAALADCMKAHALDPDNAEICNNIGAALQWLGRSEQALAWFDKAFALSPTTLGALTNKAIALGQLHRFDEVFAIYDQVTAIDPGNAKAELGRGHLYLLKGNFEAGWAAREARLRLPSPFGAYPEFSQPAWRGQEAVDGRTILIFADEGLGDTVQFARYVPLLAARGARVILAVDRAVVPLLAGLAGVAQCVAKSDALPPFDLHCPLSSLPLAFGTRLESIPSSAYLPAPAPAAERVAAWQHRLGAPARLRVGLVWSGNPNHTNDYNRSVPFRLLSPLLHLDATCVSLQKDARPGDRALLGQSSIVDLTAHLHDFGETAALVSCLDLVISVDTSVAHLAAALGRPTWILLPYTPDYRWLLDRDDSPWYPTARLFRQTATRDHAEVIDRVRGELSTLIADRFAERHR